MLDEYVLVPDIFQPTAYSNAALIDAYLPFLREPLLQEALVRDLSDGGWSKYCMANSEQMHRLCKELLKKLAQGNRLRRQPLVGNQCPDTAIDWCKEGVGSGAALSVTGIIAAHQTKDLADFKNQGQVASIERLTATNWWQQRSPSMELDRKTPAYLAALQRILAQANSLMFIDPYLDPSNAGYRNFYQLLLPVSQRNPAPAIELHRSFNRGVAAGVSPTEQFWKQRFSALGAQLTASGLAAEVYIWRDFHDRHIVSDVIGITASAGFDETGKPNDLTTWSRMGRAGKDKMQRRFDPSAQAGDLLWRFTI